MKIAVARDEAFNFTYRENIDRLREIGEVVFFSPIRDRQFPLNAAESSLLYLPGGYPEFFLRSLSANALMLTAIHDFIEEGGRCLAECGGMMYLCQHIIDEEGMAWPMYCRISRRCHHAGQTPPSGLSRMARLQGT